MSRIDDLTMMTQRCNELASMLAKSLEALSVCVRYPEPEYGARSKAESVLGECNSWLKAKQADDEIDRVTGHLTNEFGRAVRRRTLMESLSREQRIILGIKES